MVKIIIISIRYLSVQQRYVLGAIIFIIYAMSAVYRSGFPLIFTQMVYLPNVGSNRSSNKSNGELICPIGHSTAKNETTNSVRIKILLAKNCLLIFCLFILNHIKIDAIGNRYQWSQEFQGIILSSMFWGDIVSKLPGGIAVQKYGGKIILLIAVFSSAIVLSITPLAVIYGRLIICLSLQK